MLDELAARLIHSDLSCLSYWRLISVRCLLQVLHTVLRVDMLVGQSCVGSLLLGFGQHILQRFLVLIVPREWRFGCVRDLQPGF